MQNKHGSSNELAGVWLYDSLKEVNSELRTLREVCTNLLIDVKVLNESNLYLKNRLDAMTLKLDDLDKKDATNTYLKQILRKLLHPGYFLLMGLLSVIGFSMHGAPDKSPHPSEIIKALNED